MLRKLSIQNYAIIQDLEIQMGKGLVILTGETGSGKSILLGALGLIMGERADTKVVFNPEQKCVVEASFDVSAYKLQDFFQEHDLDYEDLTILRREINPNGKTRAFVNDTPVNLVQLKDLSERLVDLHRQFDTLSISSEKFQVSVVDAIADSSHELKQYQSTFLKRQKLIHTLHKLEQLGAEAIKEQEFLQYQYDELEAAGLKADEQESLEEELNVLGNAEEIKKQAGICFQSLSDAEISAQGLLEHTIQALTPLTRYHKGVEQLCERLDSVLIEVQDIASELEEIFEQTEHDPARLEEVQHRLDLIYKLQKKHQVESIAELLEIQHNLHARLASFNDISEQSAQLSKEIKALDIQLDKEAEQLRKVRAKAYPIIEQKVKSLLEKVNMQHASLKVETSPLTQFAIDGPDKIRFLFAANKGSSYQEIKDVASGGEMSRLALCIKSIVGKALSLPTMIFDEIDTGVSGQVALQMSAILKQLSDDQQVIVITHTPQVASRATQHFVVYKEVMPDRTYTRIKDLSMDQRIHHIAVMLSTDPPSGAALENAKELISL